MSGDDVVPKYQNEPEKFISARTVFATVKAIVASGKEAEFLQLCEEQGRGVVIRKDDNNFLKDYLAAAIRDQKAEFDELDVLAPFTNVVKSFPEC